MVYNVSSWNYISLFYRSYLPPSSGSGHGRTPNSLVPTPDGAERVLRVVQRPHVPLLKTGLERLTSSLLVCLCRLHLES